MHPFLMDYCLSWKTAACDVRVQKARTGTRFPIFPVDEGQKELDLICAACPSSCFRIDTLECPVCHEGVKIVKGNPPKVKVTYESNNRLVFHFICENCGRDLFCERDLLA